MMTPTNDVPVLAQVVLENTPDAADNAAKELQRLGFVIDDSWLITGSREAFQTALSAEIREDSTLIEGGWCCERQPTVPISLQRWVKEIVMLTLVGQ